MEARNLITITVSNIRLIVKQTLFPAMLILFIIPVIYGTSNLDSVKSADCLARMAALIGLPMFVPLLKPEQDANMDTLITLRPIPYRMIVLLRMGLSLICTFAFICAFEVYMYMEGCAFPVGAYTFRALMVTTLLGFIGLLASAISMNTVVGYLASFLWYCALRIEKIGAVFSSVSNVFNVYQALLLSGVSAAIILFSSLPDREKSQ